jgi:hypothetical protein
MEDEEGFSDEVLALLDKVESGEMPIPQLSKGLTERSINIPSHGIQPISVPLGKTGSASKEKHLQGAKDFGHSILRRPEPGSPSKLPAPPPARPPVKTVSDPAVKAAPQAPKTVKAKSAGGAVEIASVSSQTQMSQPPIQAQCTPEEIERKKLRAMIERKRLEALRRRESRSKGAT